MSDFEALFLGVVQGLTEFLPVSSSGHLVVYSTLLGLEPDGGLLFEVAVHVATLFAIVIYYRDKIGRLIVGVFTRERASLRYVAKLAVATLPTVVAVIASSQFLEEVLSDPLVAAGGLIVTGAVLWTTRTTLPNAHLNEPTWKAVFYIGVAQAFAILPGISRSGSTVAVALAMGVAPIAAAQFSFLMGIIAISSAAVLMIPDLGSASPEALTSIALGSISALVSGVVAIWLFVVVLGRESFHQFAYYTLPVGVLFGLYVWSS